MKRYICVDRIENVLTESSGRFEKLVDKIKMGIVYIVCGIHTALTSAAGMRHDPQGHYRRLNQKKS
ncbi:MAG: hypothetical protein KKF56_01935 [Nanoarchaeota archaeon]|nr:hypothetical protein [Nanoarchaeota archaeon]